MYTLLLVITIATLLNTKMWITGKNSSVSKYFVFISIAINVIIIIAATIWIAGPLK
jgi:hypothetical protein